MRWTMLIAPTLFGLAIVAGMVMIKRSAAPPPDPNDPKEVGLMDASIIQRNLKWASDFVNERRSRKEISDREGKDMLAAYAEELTSSIDVNKVPVQEAYKYGDLLRTAREWEKSEILLTQAVEHANEKGSEERRIVDALRLADVKAHLGKVKEAMTLVKSTFDAKPTDKAPILLATYLEVIPAARGKGHDVELGLLLEDAIVQHAETTVDIGTESGAAFIVARGYHMNKAWELARSLFRDAKRVDLIAQIPRKMKEASDRIVPSKDMR